MKLRKLKKTDAPFMLEWMHDTTVIKYMKTDFMSKGKDDCIKFIELAQDTKNNVHFAIVNERDEYLGTVSLKHISEGNAEFGITVRSMAMGTGASQFGMKEIIKYGFEVLGLKCIYWCVSPINKRAVHFYEKNGFWPQIVCIPEIKDNYSEDEIKHYLWFKVNNTDLIV